MAPTAQNRIEKLLVISGRSGIAQETAADCFNERSGGSALIPAEYPMRHAARGVFVLYIGGRKSL